ncbi:RidA family protein [Paenibacillus harenae]|uniref:Enamine deaminase RidA (YjgF/YER057c/UK114 family) n=1 Tax=Paenibacillus harenae TaxID=306543 RepID=A0ABT9U9A6_PAEHA|nr:RidA family protein [Paenibacillus harenae]MDQ0062174.1 enamine deaminase RidA (YjgF/YER057c/UK114 family) [Paenibacillus harenae]MDQ0115842.1 enamine deaminase RidA (YjgF/YER057c/UK114 family) [Paenibacillus harenae]
MAINRNVKVLIGTAILSCFIGASVYASTVTPNKFPLTPMHEPEFYGSPSSSIASAVALPGKSATFSTSGTVPPLLNKDGATVYERYGNTEKQAEGIMKNIEKQLTDQGLSLKDVVYLRVYVTPDAALQGKFDYTGWFNAYAKFFNTKENPVKPARSTVGVAGLVNADWLIEIEAVAAYPTPHNQD